MIFNENLFRKSQQNKRFINGFKYKLNLYNKINILALDQESCQGWGRGFKSLRPLQFSQSRCGLGRFKAIQRIIKETPFQRLATGIGARQKLSRSFLTCSAVRSTRQATPLICGVGATSSPPWNWHHASR